LRRARRKESSPVSPSSTSALPATSAGKVIPRLRATFAMTPMKQADQPMANNYCSGLVPGLSLPGVASLTSRAPSLERPAPSRPQVVWV